MHRSALEPLRVMQLAVEILVAVAVAATLAGFFV